MTTKRQTLDLRDSLRLRGGCSDPALPVVAPTPPVGATDQLDR
ncbi:MAG: hypothetical protein AAGF11_05280 [Myxococcota bacterium]